MEIVTILWSTGATVAIVLAAMCGLLWLSERQNRASLMLGILGIAVAAAAYVQLGIMHSATAAEYGEWQRWYHLPAFFALMAQLLFVHYYLGTGRSWLMWAIIIARSVVLVVNFSVHPNFNFSNIVSLRHVSLFGEQVSTIGVAVPRSEWQWLATASFILLMAYLIDATTRRWLKGGRVSRRRALAVSLGIILPLLCTLIVIQLTVNGLPQSPLFILPWYLGALLVMAYELGRDYIRSKHERLELAELRARLAQVDRVRAMGQLASSLAHELSQPLAATAANVEAGRAQLKREKPDLEELDSILDDIGRDDHRASEIINRMRQLFKRRTIEVHPIRVEDAVQDVVLLVRSEATSNRVALHLQMEPGLPHVFGDRVHLTQVLLNLVMNSIHAVQSRPLNDRHIGIEARADDTKGEVEITVRDSGPGIPDNIVDEVFSPFFTTKSEGMGMGLALSRTIVEAHGGRLWFDHSTGQDGAIFHFTLRRVLERQPTSLPVANSDPIPKGA